MKVKRLNYNWRMVGSTLDRDGCGEDYSYFEVGIHDVVDIEENEPRNGMDTWNYVVTKTDGTTCRIFNPNYVEYLNQKG